MILPVLVPRDPDPNCSPNIWPIHGSTAGCEHKFNTVDLVLVCIFGGIFVLLLASAALLLLKSYFATRSGSCLTHRKLRKERRPTPSVSTESYIPPTSELKSFENVLDPYHNMSKSFDDPLVLDESSSDGVRVPEPVYSASGTTPPPPAYVPVLTTQSSEAASAWHPSYAC